MKRRTPSPREFLKARRPERFSDSSTEEVTELDRGLLEYHLETLTSRSQETQFENFARALVKLQICPNLLPHTGPTGGGDSKVDAETYPVADSLALAWYVGTGRESASERWAFAFSAKSKWPEKLKSDISKITATRRGYAKAFFVTNQFVRDKQRSTLEDTLSKAHNLDVRILDRTWILDAVFDNQRQEIAIQELGVSPSIRKQVSQGPLDRQREARLSRLESRIERSISLGEIAFVTVDDCIDAAIVSRESECPQIETLGRFDRADNVALRYGTQYQKVRCAYERAWTAFFWYEDIDSFTALYDVVEERTAGSRHVHDLELLTNLWMLLYSHSHQSSNADRHTTILVERLTTFAEDDTLPTAALQARVFLLNIKLMRAIVAHEPAGPLIREFSRIIEESDRYVGFPLLQTAECLIGLGDRLGDFPEYGVLHDQLVDVVSRRKGEVEGAKLLVRRAGQQLDADRPVEAIGTAGRALHRLAKEESRALFCDALYMCACAYERIGLLWAARGTLLMAASTSMSDFWKYEDVTPFQSICFRRLKWIELQLGRIPDVLSWHEIDSLIRAILIDKGYGDAWLKEGMDEFDAILGILMLKMDLWDLKSVVQLPDLLSAMDLEAASTALLHALGHDGPNKAELMAGAVWASDAEFFLSWRDQPASEDLPEAPDLCNERTVRLRSHVLGCAVDVTTPNEPPFVELGESFLAALESALATGLVRRIVAREPRLCVAVVKSEFCESPFEFTLDDEAGYPELTIKARTFDPDGGESAFHQALKARIAEVVAAGMACIVIPDREQMKQMLTEDLSFSRAIDFSGSFRVLGNVLGDQRKRYTSDWVRKTDREYSVTRGKAWDAEYARKHVPPRPGNSPPDETAELDYGRFVERFQTTRHNQVKTLSLIRESLWEKAGWQGLGVVVFSDVAPILALVFGEREPARRIFSLWERELGKKDENEALRITIIRHIDKRNPHHYRVVIGSNVAPAKVPRGGAFFSVSRVHMMTPESSQNLDSFLEAYRIAGEYVLAPAVVRRGGKYPESVGDFGIAKRELVVKEAWEIGRHDVDVMGIEAEDQPVVPEGVTDPPVNEVLDWRRSLPAETRSSQRSDVEHAARARSWGALKEKRKKEKRKRQEKRNSRKRR